MNVEIPSPSSKTLILLRTAVVLRSIGKNTQFLIKPEFIALEKNENLKPLWKFYGSYVDNFFLKNH